MIWGGLIWLCIGCQKHWPQAAAPVLSPSAHEQVISLQMGLSGGSHQQSTDQ